LSYYHNIQIRVVVQLAEVFIGAVAALSPRKRGEKTGKNDDGLWRAEGGLYSLLINE
jgi:hypothetical protein